MRVPGDGPEMNHHDQFIASHGKELHRTAREQWQALGRGVIIVEDDDGGHRVSYLTEDTHRRNITEGVYSEDEGEATGGLLAQYRDPDEAFPVIMYHASGMMTACLVRPVPVHGRG
jgi:hypothetical protein